MKRSEAQEMFEKELRDKAIFKNLIEEVANLNPNVMNRAQWIDIIEKANVALLKEKR